MPYAKVKGFFGLPPAPCACGGLHSADACMSLWRRKDSHGREPQFMSHYVILRTLFLAYKPTRQSPNSPELARTRPNAVLAPELFPNAVLAPKRFPNAVLAPRTLPERCFGSQNSSRTLFWKLSVPTASSASIFVTV